MKQFHLILFILLCGIWSPSTAQDPDFDNYQTQLDYLFANIDLTDATSGFLLERGYSFACVECNDGNTLSPGNLGDPSHFGLLYSTLQSSELNNPSVLPASQFYQDPVAPGAPVPLAILTYNYHALSETAIDEGILDTINSQLVYGPNPGNVFVEQTLFAMTPLRQVFDEPNISFVLPASKIATNLNVSAWEVDFGNGYQSISVGSPVSYLFPGDGVHDIKLRAVLADGTRLLSHARIGIRPNDGDRFSDDPDDVFTTEVPGAILEVYYSDCTDNDNSLYKPLIVFDGFDFDNSQDFERIRRKFEGVEFGSQGENLLDHIEDNGYDIVFVDFQDHLQGLDQNAVVGRAAVGFVNSLKNANGESEPIFLPTVATITAMKPCANRSSGWRAITRRSLLSMAINRRVICLND